MSAAKHTPGPWFTFANGQCIGGPVGPLGNPSGADTAGVAHAGMGLRTGTEVKANARLIAAAPELLCELRKAVQMIEALNSAYGSDEVQAVAESGSAAIAKATGSAS